jgi:hypothetical protein
MEAPPRFRRFDSGYFSVAKVSRDARRAPAFRATVVVTDEELFVNQLVATTPSAPPAVNFGPVANIEIACIVRQ